jgi:predicted dehydrogenase
MTPIRVALLGYGLAGSVFHAPFIAAADGLELAAVTTRDPERRRSAEASYPGVLVLEGPEDVFERAEDFDLAVVATPNRFRTRSTRSRRGFRSSSTSRSRRPRTRRGTSSNPRANAACS